MRCLAEANLVSRKALESLWVTEQLTYLQLQYLHLGNRVASGYQGGPCEERECWNANANANVEN